MVDTADVKESAEKAIAKKLHLKGIVLADVDVVEALDSNPGYSFTKIFNADSSVASSSDGYTPEEMAALLAHAKKMAAELADRIRSGEITPSPPSSETGTPASGATAPESASSTRPSPVMKT